MLAVGGVLTTALPPQAQSNSALRPGTDFSVTTGIGTGSRFRNVVPPPDQPPPNTSRKFMWDTPESVEAFAPNDESKQMSKEGSANGGTAAAPSAPEAPENPRTMITRDRIESPQH